MTGATRVWALNLVLLAAGVALYFGGVRHIEPLHAPLSIPWWLLGAMFYLTEVHVVHVHFRRDAHSFSLVEIPTVLGLFFVSPQGLIAAHLLGAGAALAIHRRQSPIKFTFNISHFLLETCTAVTLFNLFVHSGQMGIGTLGWASTLSATGLTQVIAVLCVFVAISLSEGSLQPQNLRHMLGLGLVVTASNSSLALIGVTVLWYNPQAAWLLLVPTATLFLAYRAYMSEREKHESLEFLYESTRILNQSRQVEAAVISLLTEMRKMFKAEQAEIILFASAEHESALRTTLGPGDRSEVMRPIDLDSDEGVWAEVANSGKAVKLAHPITDERIKDHYKNRDIKDALIGPLHGETRVVGVIKVANRLGDVTTFDDEDLKLFETLARQVSVSLENGRLEKSLAQLTELEEQLRHQAFHDALTGLANRSLFEERVEHAVSRTARQEDPVAVLFLDLDDFKTINDSFGHNAGDALLVSVAERLRKCLRPSDTAARLGGDEFAILLEDTAAANDAAMVAERIIETLRAPFFITGKEIFVHASVGIAFSSASIEKAEELLRNADVAMYRAKSHGKGRYEIFEPKMHAAVVRRSQMKAELQRAVDRHEFTLHYQPCVELSTGKITGVEALVRWNHAQKGLILPGEFISLTEETGLILPLGRWVLREACMQLKRWQEELPGHPRLTMAVNLSARQLQQPELIHDIVQVLRESGLSPQNLVLEITESVLMNDPQAMATKLRELRDLGVRLAIDDFGTGYSSLAYLQWFPIDTLKIPKSFVDGVGQGSEGSALAEAIVRMAEALDLKTVAEGIELPEQLSRLLELGCDVGQGFYFARPLAGADVESLLRTDDLDDDELRDMGDALILPNGSVHRVARRSS